MSASPLPFLRVEKGYAEPEELAAITALLLALAAGGAPSDRRCRTRAVWPHLEHPSGFRAPHSWRG